LAGICALLTDPYRRGRAGEITAPYTLPRFPGGGGGGGVGKGGVSGARAREGRAVVVWASEKGAGQGFSRLKLRRVGPKEVPASKWRGYDRTRIARLSIFHYKLD